MATLGTPLGQQRFQPRPVRIINESLTQARPYQAARLGTNGPRSLKRTHRLPASFQVRSLEPDKVRPPGEVSSDVVPEGRRDGVLGGQ